jgi:hypothetical protein
MLMELHATDALAPFGLEALRPDEFVLPHRKSLKNPWGKKLYNRQS